MRYDDDDDDDDEIGDTEYTEVEGGRTAIEYEILIKRNLRGLAQESRRAIELHDSLREEIGEEAFRAMLADPDPQYDIVRKLVRDLPRYRGLVASYEELKSRDEAN
jgi:hypothetical protein